MKIDRAIFIQLKCLGDILMITPAIRAFKRHFPDSVLDVMVEPPGNELLRLNPNIDDIIIVERKSWLSLARQAKLLLNLRKQKYDLSIDFLGNPRTAHYTFIIGARHRAGYNGSRFRYAYNMFCDKTDDYSARAKLRFLFPFGINTEDCRLDFFVDPGAELPGSIKAINEDPIVAISAVSPRANRIWPIQDYARLADYFHDEFGFRTAVIVGPGEETILAEFRKYAGSPCILLQINDLMTLGATLRRCCLLVGNDNGPKHFATALGLPTFTIYYPESNPRSWTYPDPKRHRFIGGLNQPENMPISDIPFDLVTSRIRSMIADLHIARPSTSADSRPGSR
jgi:heptosyltransferase-3